MTDAVVLRFANLPMKLGGGESEEYADFDRLSAECHTYASKEVIEWYLKDFEKLVKNNLDRVDARNRMLLSAMAAVLGKFSQPTVLDFGGGCGADYFVAKNFLGPDAVGQWVVCENPRVVETFQNTPECESEGRLRFVTDMGQIDSHVHMAYISGALQYVRAPLATLTEIADRNPEFIFLNRTPLWNFPGRLTKQLKPKSNAEEKTRLSYPCWILNESQVLKTLTDRGYEKISFHANYDRPYISGYGFLAYKSYFFRKQMPV